MRKVWYNGKTGSQGSEGRRRHAKKVFHNLCGKLTLLFHIVFHTLWKMWKSFPQKLWKSGSVENFGENSVENLLKFSTMVVESFVEKSFPQLPMENSVENLNPCHAQFPQSFYGLLIVIFKENFSRVCVIGCTKVFAFNTHIIKVFYKGVACGLCEFADMGKGGVGAVAIHECNAVFNFYYLREVGNKIIVIVTSGAVEQFFHSRITSLKIRFFVFWLSPYL